MSLFDDSDDESNWYYEPEDKFQRRVLKNAEKLDKHPIKHLAEQQAKAIETMKNFVEQDTHISKSERIAIKADVAEAEEAISRAYQVMPNRVVKDE